MERREPISIDHKKMMEERAHDADLPVKTPKEEELYRSLIRRDSAAGQFLEKVGNYLSKQDIPTERRNTLYSIYRQSLVEHIPPSRMSLFFRVLDPYLLRECMTCLWDGIPEADLIQMLEETDTVKELRVRRYRYISGTADGKRDKMAAPSGSFQNGAQLGELLAYNKKVLDYLAGDYAKLRDQVPSLQQKIIALEKDLGHAKRELMEKQLQVSRRLNIAAENESPSQTESAAGKKKRLFPRKEKWNCGGGIEGKARPPQTRKEQFLDLLTRDLSNEQMKLLAEVFHSEPKVPFAVLDAVAMPQNSPEDMRFFIENYMGLGEEE